MQLRIGAQILGLNPWFVNIAPGCIGDARLNGKESEFGTTSRQMARGEASCTRGYYYCVAVDGCLIRTQIVIR